MKKSLYLCILLLVSLLCACGQASVGQSSSTSSSTAPTWQEQYDLGVRYLSEGNYEEAIIAFTAAIEIDPKQAPAYVGRGDAYIGLGETEENLSAAQADYEKAIELDETLVGAYLALAEVYIALGDTDMAISILEKGYKITGDGNLETRLEQIQGTNNQNSFTNVRATLIANLRTYEEEIHNHNQYYGDQGGFIMYGIRFDPPLIVNIDGSEIEVFEAVAGSDCDIGSKWDNSERPEHQGEFYNWEYFDAPLTVSGYIIFDEDYQRVTLSENGHHILHPNGPYIFVIEEYSFDNQSLNS